MWSGSVIQYQLISQDDLHYKELQQNVLQIVVDHLTAWDWLILSTGDGTTVSRSS